MSCGLMTTEQFGGKIVKLTILQTSSQLLNMWIMVPFLQGGPLQPPLDEEKYNLEIWKHHLQMFLKAKKKERKKSLIIIDSVSFTVLLQTKQLNLPLV